MNTGGSAQDFSFSCRRVSSCLTCKNCDSDFGGVGEDTFLPIKNIKIQASAHVRFHSKDILQSNLENVEIEIYNGNADSI